MVRDGDQDAAAILYERYAKRVFGLVKSKLGVRLAASTEADDIVQSVFKSMFRGMASGNYDAPPGATLWNLFAVIAVHKLNSKAKHHAAQRRDTKRNVALDPEGNEADLAVDLASSEFLEICIRETLEELRPFDRDVLSLRMQNYNVEEISEAIGRSKRTVERSLQNSRQRLSDMLLEED